MTEPSEIQDEVLLQLEEKDQLIQTLTERLSEVAEQLDRAQRSGDRGSRPGGASAASSETLEQQRLLCENVSAMVEQWEDVQPRNAFGRIEARLDHMRSLLESALESGFTSGAVLPPEFDAHAEADAQPDDATDQEEDGPQEALSGWEAMKAQLLVGNSAATPDPEPQASHDAADSTPPDAGPVAAEPTPPSPTNAGDQGEFPQPVDFDTAERADLEQAIDVRDQFIGVLSRRLRSEQQRTRQAIDWNALNDAPEELRESLQSLEADLQDRLRIAEVELSLERARLSRIQSRIEEMQRQIEAQVESTRKRGSSNSTAELRAAANGDSAESKGWFNNLRRRS